MNIFYVKCCYVSMLSVLKNYIKFTMIYHFYWKKKKIVKAVKLVAKLLDRKCCRTQNNFKASAKLWISIRKSTYSHWIHPEVWLKTNVDMNTELRKMQKYFLKRFF